MKKNKKLLALVCCMALLVGTVGATLAWLADKSDPVENTFTVGDINIDLTETFNKDTDGNNEADAWEGKIIPGTDLTKDPLVTVFKESEKCYLFVKITEQDWPAVTEEESNVRKVNYTVADGWTLVEKQGGVYVYYRIVDMDTTNNQEFPVLGGNKIIVSETLTKEEMKRITKPFKLICQAYAVQYENIYDSEKTEAENAAFAWGKAKEATE